MIRVPLLTFPTLRDSAGREKVRTDTAGSPIMLSHSGLLAVFFLLVIYYMLEQVSLIMRVREHNRNINCESALKWILVI